MPVRALFYDIEANLPALEAVIDAAERAGAVGYLVGGDAVSSGPWPAETLAVLRMLPDVGWLRGNGERWMREPPEAEMLRGAWARARDALAPADVDWLCALPHRHDEGDVVYCHASPASDEQGFPAEASADDQRLLAGVRARAVCFGHTHVQFRRQGPRGIELINAGSVGMPWDGDPRAAWATYSEDGFELQRTEYDIERAIAGALSLGDERRAGGYRSGSRS